MKGSQVNWFVFCVFSPWLCQDLYGLLHHQQGIIGRYLQAGFFQTIHRFEITVTAMKRILWCLPAQNLHGMKFKPLFGNVRYQN